MDIRRYLDIADLYARHNSGCRKVHVGSLILHNDTEQVLSLGANITLPVSCRAFGCRRVELYGDDAKSHRNCGDCRALHSEVDALVKLPSGVASAMGKGELLAPPATPQMTIFVTRYPCEECAKAIVASGIRRVYYGRQQEISELTKEIFKAAGVSVTWINDWTREDTDR